MSVSSPFQRSIGASCGGGQEKPSRVYVSILDATKKWFVYEENPVVSWFHRLFSAATVAIAMFSSNVKPTKTAMISQHLQSLYT